MPSTSRHTNLLLFLVLLGWTTLHAHAQDGTISGRVIQSSDNQPLPGANILVKDTDHGTVSDAFGRFTLSGVPIGQTTLVISYVGYTSVTEEITLSENDAYTLTIELQQDEEQLGEILVRTERIVRNMQETTSSIAMADAERLQSLGVTEWRDAMRLFGNVQLDGVGTFTIRGVAYDGSTGYGANPVSTIYIDGVPQSRNSARIGTRGSWDMETIEVLRGPQSTTSGRNALAGAVYLRSKSPTFEWIGNAQVGYGSDGLFEGGLVISGPLVKDQLAIRIAGYSIGEDQGVSYDNREIPSLNQLETTLYRQLKTSLLFTPKGLPQFSMKIASSLSFDRPGIYQNVEGPNFNQRRNSLGYGTNYEGNVKQGTLEMVYEFSNKLALTSVTTILDSEFDNDGFSYTAPGVENPFGFESGNGDSDLSQEIRLNLDTDKVEAVFGLYGVRTRNSGDTRVQYNAASIFQTDFPVYITGTGSFETDVDNGAVFGEVNWRVANRLKLIAGARFDAERQDLLNAYSVIVEPPLIELPDEFTGLKPSFNSFLPKAGFMYDITRDVAVGLTVQRGYRGGGQSLNLFTGEPTSYDPERTWNYELSARTRWANGRLIANANVFYTDWTDQQVPIPIPEQPNFSITQNAANSTLVGAEIDFRALPVTGLDLFGSIGVVRTNFENFISQEQDENGQIVDIDFSGNRFPNDPALTLGIGGQYQPVNSGIFIAGDISYTGDYYATPANTDDLKAGGYTLIGVRTGYRWQRFGVTVFGDNLLDEAAMTSIWQDRNGQGNGYVARILPGRTFGIRLHTSLN